MKITSPAFEAQSSAALLDVNLQKALKNVEKGFIGKRIAAAEALPEFEALRDRARDIKNHVLGHLDLYLEAYERKVVASGGIAQLDDLRALRGLVPLGVEGAIVGTALYVGNFTLAEALEVTAG